LRASRDGSDEADYRGFRAQRLILENGPAPLTLRTQLILAGSGSGVIGAKRDGKIAKRR
jgi:hypothetical protein